MIKVLIKPEEGEKSYFYRRGHKRCSIKKVFLKISQNL